MNTESDFEHEAGDAAPEKHAPNDKKAHQTPFQPHQHFLIEDLFERRTTQRLQSCRNFFTAVQFLCDIIYNAL